ncbi:unannotated protein [freshwater metagenome]|uniref:Unannotated protein n=1 Tax=freshwater metagenome TaxID=449393 RepID=A0A6J7T5T7_9ZZZZ
MEFKSPYVHGPETEPPCVTWHLSSFTLGFAVTRAKSNFCTVVPLVVMTDEAVELIVIPINAEIMVMAIAPVNVARALILLYRIGCSTYLLVKSARSTVNKMQRILSTKFKGRAKATLGRTSAGQCHKYSGYEIDPSH